LRLNASIQMQRVASGWSALPRHFLPRLLGRTSCGVRRHQSGAPQSTAIVGVGRPSVGGRRTIACASPSGAHTSEVLLPSHCPSNSAWAACPSAVSARSWFARAPRAMARCSSVLARGARRGCVQPRVAVLRLASGVSGCHFGVGAVKLTGVNAVPARGHSSAVGAVRSRSAVSAVANPAPNPSFKRTSPGVPWAAA
jgi:hypothetical protein